MTHSAWWLAVNALAVHRLSLLVSKDKITAPLRERIRYRGYGRRARAWRSINALVICPWCLSVWFGIGAVALTGTAPGAWQWPATALALSGVTVLLTRR